MNWEKINWNDSNLDLDEILWIEDIDKNEWFYCENVDVNNTINETGTDIINIVENFWNLSFLDTIEYLEEQLNIKVEYSEKWRWQIKLLTNSNDLIWSIWADNYILESNVIDENHLWIEVYWEYQWKKFSNILYNLYKKYSLENSNIFYPEIDFASKNSRISLLLKQWYILKEKYVNWFFIPVNQNDIDIINYDIKNNFYWKQEHSYKFISED